MFFHYHLDENERYESDFGGSFVQLFDTIVVCTPMTVFIIKKTSFVRNIVAKMAILKVATLQKEATSTGHFEI